MPAELGDENIPRSDWEQYVQDNCLVLVRELQAKIRRLRKELAKLNHRWEIVKKKAARKPKT